MLINTHMLMGRKIYENMDYDKKALLKETQFIWGNIKPDCALKYKLMKHYKDESFLMIINKIEFLSNLSIKDLYTTYTINKFNQDRFGEFNFNTNFVFSYAKNKVEFNAEAQQRYDWLSATGRPIGQPFGYTWIGYYTPEEVDLIHAGAANAPAVPNTDVPIQAGDLKYKDLNGDGVINDFDKGAIGKPNLPNTTLGWTIGGSWKGLSVSVLFQGSFNYSFSVNGTGIEPFKSQFQPLHQKRWTLERYLNGEAIEFPRLTSNPSTVNSAAAYMSDFWLIDAWYIRLKTIDVSYQVPTKVLPSWLTNLRVYLNAYNMFTWTSFDKYQQDPEIKSNSAGDAYMNQRVFNLGVQLTF